MMPKSVCQLVFEEYPRDSRIRRYANLLVAEGFNVRIVAIKGERQKLIEHDGEITIYRVPLSKRRSSFGRRIVEYALFQAVCGCMATYFAVVRRVRIFHVNTLPDFLIFSCVVPKLLGAMLILDFHELFPEFMCQHKPNLGWNSPLIRLLRLQERMSFMFADEVITFSDPAREILTERISASRPVTTVMNYNDTSEIPNITRATTGKFRIVYNGTINFNLNLGMILDALDTIRQSHPQTHADLEFHLYGAGPELQNILGKARQLGLDNVVYHGSLPYKEMMRELSTASVCVLPPKKDIYSELYYSAKLTEMVFLKIPVIATRLRTYMRYYPEGCMFYFESENVRELAQKIRFVYENPGIAAQYCERAFLEYHKYDETIMKERYRKIIQRLIGE